MRRRNFLSSLGVASLSLLSFPSQSDDDTPPVWSTAAELPIHTQELYSTVHNGRLYVAGGIAAKLGIPYFTNRCFSYEPATDSWREEASFPEDRHHAALVSTESRLFMVGGFNGRLGHIWKMRSTVHELVNDEWVLRGNLPQPQAEGVLSTAPDGAVHLVTGQSPKGNANKARSDHHEVATHLRWLPEQSDWQALPAIPTPRNSATGGWVGDQLIITGGRTANGNLDVTEIYDLSSRQWRTAAPMPLPQAGTASVVVDDGLIVFGGEIFTPKAAVFANVWHFSLSANKWSSLPDLPTPRHGIGAGLINGKAYIIGGATSPGGRGTTNINEALDVTRLKL